MRIWMAALALVSLTATLPAAEKYTGDRPAKADVLYIYHAGKLIETEVAQARQETRKDQEVAWIEGGPSNARTPVPEPIFIVKAEKLQPERLQVYRLEVKGNRREVVLSTKKGKNQARPIPVVVTRLEPGLYKVEVDQLLDPGEYTLSPDGSNETYSFQVY
jgi:hypothetical protein